MNQANLLFGYEIINMIIVWVTTKEKSLVTNFNQQNWMLVFRLLCINQRLLDICYENFYISNRNLSKWKKCNTGQDEFYFKVQKKEF